MKCLPYCILRQAARVAHLSPAGIDGKPVSIVVGDRLAAACSLVADAYATATLPRATAYARVVEALHSNCTVLPMRYGCILESEARLVALLRERHAEFHASLDRLEGCVEMGVRLLLCQSGRRTPLASRHGAPPLSAKGYLLDRAAQYAEEDAQKERQRRWDAGKIERTKRALDGAFVECRVRRSAAGSPPSLPAGTQAAPQLHPSQQPDREDAVTPGTAQAGLLSLDFLVRRDKLACFRQAFSRLQQGGAEKMLLTGPWPPYSFASCAMPEACRAPAAHEAFVGDARAARASRPRWLGQSE